MSREILFNLKPGARLRCHTPAPSMRTGKCVLKGYYPLPSWGNPCSRDDAFGLLIEGAPNKWGGVDEGWRHHRFSLICDADGADYQAADDCDLSCEPFTNGRD